MNTSTTHSLRRVRVELFVRTNPPTEAVERLADLAARVRRLEDRTTVAEVAVETWTTVRPALEALSDSEPAVSPVVDAFEEWADRAGYSLSPSFARCETESLLSRGSRAELRVPLASLAVYEDETLRWVAPCSDGERSYSVEDCLAALEEGGIEPSSERTLRYRDPDALEERSRQ
ncbi:HTH domain-containing protein [Natronococcus sp.]|uniref:HTH domain-containing protein n=1 Tax=Natronococcus sp. TaxID=35747 RepID=UPI003A4DBBBF